MHVSLTMSHFWTPQSKSPETCLKNFREIYVADENCAPASIFLFQLQSHLEFLVAAHGKLSFLAVHKGNASTIENTPRVGM